MSNKINTCQIRGTAPRDYCFPLKRCVMHNVACFLIVVLFVEDVPTCAYRTYILCYDSKPYLSDPISVPFSSRTLTISLSSLLRRILSTMSTVRGLINVTATTLKCRPLLRCTIEPLKSISTLQVLGTVTVVCN